MIIDTLLTSLDKEHRRDLVLGEGLRLGEGQLYRMFTNWREKVV